jgi:hypothetical protein
MWHCTTVNPPPIAHVSPLANCASLAPPGLAVARDSAASPLMGGRRRGGTPGSGGGGQQRQASMDGALGARVEDYVRAHQDKDPDDIVQYLR